jgi:hypothetical protein
MSSTTRTAKLQLETLDDRLTPSTTTLNLTTQGAVATQPGFVVEQTDWKTTNDHDVKSFLRIDGNGTEQGYNSTARRTQFDESRSPEFNRSLRLDHVPLVTVNGVQYREFLLGIDQKVRIYVGNRPDLSGYDAGAKTLAGRKAVFDLDRNGDVSVLLDSRLSRGSQSGDMFLLVPASDFAGSASRSFVYLYSKMGAQSGAAANGGFEEWSVRRHVQQTTTGTGSLSGYVYADQNVDGEMDEGDNGISGVNIQLQGTDVHGKAVQPTGSTPSPA